MQRGKLWVSALALAWLFGPTTSIWSAAPAAAIEADEDATSSEADETDVLESAFEASDEASDASDVQQSLPAPDDSAAELAPAEMDEAEPAPAATADDEPAVLGMQLDDSAAAEPQATLPPAEPTLEIVRERYPNRAVKIERSVTQDAQGNYVNHGPWKMFDAKGNLVAEGRYHFGQRQGVWNRWYRTAEVEFLTKPPYNQFQGPWVSQANFNQDQLDGVWTIYDGKQHKISHFEFKEGTREGHWTWWLPSGRKLREVEYSHGDIDGQLLEWAPDGRLTTKETFQNGRKLAMHLESFPGAGKKSEGLLLFAKQTMQNPDSWWDGKFATYTKAGKDEKHGPWISWYTNGQKQSEGEYQHDVQVGPFAWWYQNGQKAIEGGFVDGEQDGRWVWWHESGQKAIQGVYAEGHPSGRWIWWNQDGKVARASEIAQGAGEILPVPATPPQQTARRSDGIPAAPKMPAVR